MKKPVLMLFFLMMSLGAGTAAAPDFGADGLKGLSPEQVKGLAAGEIIFSTDDSGTETREALVQAAIVFDKTPKEVWNLLYHTEDQIKYLEEIDELKIISKEKLKDCIEFKLKFAWISVVYRVIHRFEAENLYYYWTMDRSFKNDLQDLRGFWRLYSYGNGKTLARYGSNVSVKNVPSFIEAMFKKNGVRKALTAVRNYINSGGTWRKK